MIIEKLLRSNIPPQNETWNCWTLWQGLLALNLPPIFPTTSKDICNMKFLDAINEFKKSLSMPTDRKLDMAMLGPYYRDPLNKHCNCTCHVTKSNLILKHINDF